VYVILNACRTYAYLRTGNILSKDEGGVWALQVLPEQFHATVVTALDAYRNQKDDSSLSKDAFVNFACYLRNEFKRVLCLSPVE
jgi:streptomycin 3"-adenylyltransferase